ncbi:hypothetical protein F5Y08DRAFT_337202 [Xylaria arbuscula]|nr:hypothetical protein F5Y08DRAFT_337202 [Xylaria arbuscula]
MVYLWLNFRYQDRPWDQTTRNTFIRFDHDCMFDHQKRIVDDVLPRLHGCDAEAIKARSAELRNQLLTNPTTAQQFLRYEIESEFSSLDIDNATFPEISDMLDSWAVLLDKLFFEGCLTQGPERLINVRLSRYANFSLYHGMTAPSINPPNMSVMIYLRNYFTGHRRPKLELFNTLLHEMCHAYENALFNFCPVNNDAEKESWANDFHGLIWQHVYYNAIEVVSTTFRPCFFGQCARYARPATGEPAPVRTEADTDFSRLAFAQVYKTYQPAAVGVGRFLDDWMVDRRPANPRLDRALLVLRYTTKENLLLSKLPRMRSITVALIVSQVVLFWTLVAVLWAYGLFKSRTIRLLIQLIYYEYIVEGNILHSQQLWLWIFGGPFLRLMIACMVVKMYWDIGWLEWKIFCGRRRLAS